MLNKGQLTQASCLAIAKSIVLDIIIYINPVHNYWRSLIFCMLLMWEVGHRPAICCCTVCTAYIGIIACPYCLSYLLLDRNFIRMVPWQTGLQRNAFVFWSVGQAPGPHSLLSLIAFIDQVSFCRRLHSAITWLFATLGQTLWKLWKAQRESAAWCISWMVLSVPRPELNLFLFDLLPWSQHTTSWWRAQLLCSCFAHVNCLLISSLTVFLQMNFSFTTCNVTLLLSKSSRMMCSEILALLLFCWCFADLWQESRQCIFVGQYSLLSFNHLQHYVQHDCLLICFLISKCLIQRRN